MRILVVGCLHGELEKLYEVAREIEASRGQFIDLIICCGDFQAVRNPADMRSLNVPPKYAHLQSFYKFYNGECTAPILTIFVGGNHESTHFLQELPYGGWVAPNIYYMGYANIINVGGLRIAGLSGIFNYGDYHQGHLEHPPYTSNSRVTAYHVRALEVLRLRQVRARVDIALSHDWPRGVVPCAGERATQQLLRFKPHFREDLARGVLGSPASAQLLAYLQPRFWFAAHLHCKFASRILHQDSQRVTNFLALDKCLPRRQFLQFLEIEPESPSVPVPLSSAAVAPSSISEISPATCTHDSNLGTGGPNSRSSPSECTGSSSPTATCPKAQPETPAGDSSESPVNQSEMESPDVARNGEREAVTPTAELGHAVPQAEGPQCKQGAIETETECDANRAELVSSMVTAAAHSLRTGGLERVDAEREEAAVAAASEAARWAPPPPQFLVGVDGDRIRPHVNIGLDAEWLAILRKTDEYSRLRSRIDCIPSGGDFAPTEAEMAAVVEDFGGDLSLPENWAPTAPIHTPGSFVPAPVPTEAAQARTLYLNPQTALVCAMLGVTHAGAELAKARAEQERAAGGRGDQQAKRGRVEHSSYAPHRELGDLREMLVVRVGDFYEGEGEQLAKDLAVSQAAVDAVPADIEAKREGETTSASNPPYNPDQISIDDD